MKPRADEEPQVPRFLRLKSKFGKLALDAIQAVTRTDPSAAEGSFWSKTWVPAGHYYSPIADTNLIRRNADRIFNRNESIPGIELDFQALRQRSLGFQAIATEMDIPETKIDERRYFFQNPAFSYGDAITYSWILSQARPKRVIEVGSGYSSCLLLDARDRLELSSMAITFIEPYPDLLYSLLGAEQPDSVRVLQKPVQEVETAVFETLEANDVIFVDSTHVTKVDSDVNHHLFRILPNLRSGVYIHFHDIFYPFEYPKEWIFQENRSWNENYILRAFLMYNDRYEIVFFNGAFDFIADAADRERCPTFFKNSGGSLWLRKR
jgi:hypothetical protein